MRRELGFLLDWPWGLLDPAARTAVAPGDELSLDPQRAPLLALPEDADLPRWRVVRGRALLQPETPVFQLGTRRWRLRALPLPRTEAEHRIRLAQGPDGAFDIEFRRPACDSRTSGDDPDDFDPRRSRAVGQMLGLLGRLRGGRQEDPLLLPWQEVAERWLAGPERFDPRLSAIVRHAHTLRRLLADLAERPRRVLRREHRMLPLDRAQEWDRRALLWYARRPGRTFAEKAGPGQTVLALARTEEHDTLENRVLRGLLELSARAARKWCKDHHRLESSERFVQVHHYGRLTKRLAHSLADVGVRLPGPSPQPNYPLLFDARYRRVWNAYRELLREQWRRDELRRWAHRLFDEVVRILVHATLVARHVPDARRLEPVGALPLVLRGEQERGRFAVPLASALLLVAADGSYALQTFEPARTVDAERATSLGEAVLWWRTHAVLTLRFERPGTQRRAWMSVFAIWDDDWERTRRDGLASLERALRRLEDEMDLEHGSRVPLGAIALVRADPEAGVDFEMTRDRRVAAVRIPVDDSPFSDDVYVLRNFLDEFAARWLG